MLMSQKKEIYHRRNYFVKKDFQIRFILKFCGIVLTGAVISTGLLFLFSQDTLTSSFQHSRLVIMDTGTAILPAVIYTNLITLGLITAAVIVVTLLASHRIAGPVFRFEKELKEIGQGNLTKKIALRKEDQLKDVAVALNDMVSGLRDRVRDIDAGVEQVTEYALRIKASDDLIEQLNELRKRIRENFNLL